MICVSILHRFSKILSCLPSTTFFFTFFFIPSPTSPNVFMTLIAVIQHIFVLVNREENKSFFLVQLLGNGKHTILREHFMCGKVGCGWMTCGGRTNLGHTKMENGERRSKGGEEEKRQIEKCQKDQKMVCKSGGFYN
jgi:hypothetical protein